MLEKLGGFFTIVIAVTGLAMISVYQPPTYVQIILALVGSGVCLVGVVFMFAEGRIFTKDRKGKTAPKAD
jgi:archaellum biogenesis protein FlaJ (TadC family)